MMKPIRRNVYGCYTLLFLLDLWLSSVRSRSFEGFHSITPPTHDGLDSIESFKGFQCRRKTGKKKKIFPSKLCARSTHHVSIYSLNYELLVIDPLNTNTFMYSA